MKASKDGVFSLELPDGADPALFAQTLLKLVGGPPEESDVFDTYLLNLERLFHVGAQPSRAASFQEIRSRVGRVFNMIKDFRDMFDANGFVFTQDFDGDMAVLDRVRMLLRNRNDDENKKHAWVHTLISQLMFCFNISNNVNGTNEEVAKRSIVNLSTLLEKIQSLRTLGQIDRQFAPGFKGDLEVLTWATEELRRANEERQRAADKPRQRARKRRNQR